VMGKVPGLYHQYRLLTSIDGAQWKILVDKSGNRSDVPHDYIELPQAVEARYLRIENLRVPTGKFALSGLRVFGRGHGARPEPVQRLAIHRRETDRRNAWIKWQQASGAVGYLLYCGIPPDKLYASVMLYSASEYYFRAMDKNKPYYFQIEAFNENGISA